MRFSRLLRSSQALFPFLIIVFLGAGLGLGYFFPKNIVVNALYVSGTYFPKLIVSLAAFLIFNLLAGAMAKLVLVHRERAGSMFGLIFGIYFVMGLVSLIYVAVWVPILTDIPVTHPGVELKGPMQWIIQIGNTLSEVLAKQPLLQALVAAMIIGYWSAATPSLRPIANGFIVIGDKILWLFKKLMWYYPVMIGCLVIAIPMKFGSKGMALYGETVMWVAIVTIVWSIVMIAMMKIFTQRSWKQISSYYAAVWPTGFGTGGSYDTLAVNIISAKQDLGLRPEIAEISIIFGTVLNKNCSTMSVLLVTCTVCALLDIPISLLEILLLIPPVLILGLESPGVPGGAGFFMSPIVGVLLGAPDLPIFVTTFVTIFSGLIPMLSTAGNTTDDGAVGALLQDCFSKQIGLETVEWPRKYQEMGREV